VIAMKKKDKTFEEEELNALYQNADDIVYSGKRIQDAVESYYGYRQNDWIFENLKRRIEDIAESLEDLDRTLSEIDSRLQRLQNQIYDSENL